MRLYAVFYLIAGLTAGLSIILLRFRSNGFAFVLPAGVVLSGMGWWMWTVSDPPIVFSDFAQAYYPAGRAIVTDIPILYHRIDACEATAICGYVNIPIVAFLFTPLSMFTLSTAQLLFAVLSFFAVLLAVFMLWQISDPLLARRYAVIFLFIFNGPLFYSLKEGNLTHFVLLILATGVVCLDKDRDGWAGALLAIAGVLKLPLLLLGLYFVIKRRWHVTMGFCSALAAVTAVSISYAGWESHVEWYQEAVRPFGNKGLSAFNVQSFDGFLLRLRDDALLYDWKPVRVAWELRLLRYVFAAILLGIIYQIFMRQPGINLKQSQLLELSMVLCVALIISPISWTHYYLLLLLPFSLYVGKRLPIPQHGAWLGAMAVCVLLTAPPVTFVQPTGGFISQLLIKLMVSHYWAGAILLLTLLGYAHVRSQKVPNQKALSVSVSNVGPTVSIGTVP